MNSPAIVWFRMDLRLDDNPALRAAVNSGAPVIPLYIWSPDEEGAWKPGSASRYWLHQALQSLDRDLKKHGSRLVLQHGPCIDTLRILIKKTGAGKLYFNRCYEPEIIHRDKSVMKILGDEGIAVKSYNSHLLHEPDTIHNKQGKPFRVYTPFWKHYLKLDKELPRAVTGKLPAPYQWPQSVKIESFRLVPEINWYSGISDTWKTGSKDANQIVKQFIKADLGSYAEKRNFPATKKTSRISPWLHFGQVSVRRIWDLIYKHEQKQGRITPGNAAQEFLKQLVWRDFAYHLLYHYPNIVNQPLYEKYKKFPWSKNRSHLAAWQRGSTGYPIVDAGMRELWYTGWMHNRVRMIVASFLTKDLLIHWLEGAKWFWDTLVDADLANNTMGWQWVAGCGADAAPYYRIFNPVTQGERFDPDGEYVRRWIPEISGLGNQYIHKPWEAPAADLADAGIKPGKTYPFPVVDHAEARKRALALYRELK